MLKRIMMIPISLAAAGGIPYLAINRDLATRFQAAVNELTVPGDETSTETAENLSFSPATDSPFRLASSSSEYSEGSSASGGSGTLESRSSSGGAVPSASTNSDSAVPSPFRTVAASNSGNPTSTPAGSGSTTSAAPANGTRTSNGVTTYGSGAAAASGSTTGTSGATGSPSTSSPSAATRSASGSATAGTGFSAPPLAAGQELRNPTPGLGLEIGEARGGGDWPTTPVLGKDYREVFRFDVTPNWVKANWPRVSTGWTEDQLEGYRVPLVTGTEVTDLTGSLTFFFDAEHRVQRLRFIGNTGDASRLVELVTRYFEMDLEPTRLAGLYTRRYHGKPVSVLRIAHDSVLRADRPNLQLSIVLEINNPRGRYKLSESVAELLATDPPITKQ